MDEKLKAYLKKYAIPIDFEKVKSGRILPNRIAEIIMKKGMNPMLDEQTLKKFNLEEEEWYMILANMEQPLVFGPMESAFKIADWLGIDIMFMYDMSPVSGDSEIRFEGASYCLDLASEELLSREKSTLKEIWIAIENKEELLKKEYLVNYIKQLKENPRGYNEEVTGTHYVIKYGPQKA